MVVYELVGLLAQTLVGNRVKNEHLLELLSGIVQLWILCIHCS